MKICPKCGKQMFIVTAGNRTSSAAGEEWYWSCSCGYLEFAYHIIWQ